MKSSITSFNEVWLIGVLVMIFFAWGCSDTTSFKEGEIDDSAVARSGSERVQGSKLSQEQLFTIVDSLQLSLEQERLLSVIRERPTTAEVQIARLANNPAALLKKDKSMVINVSPGKRFIVSEDTVTRRESNDVSWAGKLQDQVGRATLVLSPHGITGTLSTRSKHFRFAPLGKGLQALIRVDASKFPPEHPPNYSSEIRLDSAYTHKQGTVTQHGETSFTTTSSVNSGSADAGVLVVYTQAAENAAGDIDDLIQTAIDETNHSYDNSNIYAQTYLAHSAQVSYNEAGNTYGQHLDYLEDNSDGIIDNVHNLRDQYLADVVILIVNDDSYCGIANLLANSATAFGVVHYHCATAPAFSFGHEIGHLQGAQHDVDEDTNPYFTYGHGYVDPNDQWRTIMAYPDACSGCNRVQYWSNPNG